MFINMKEGEWAKSEKKLFLNNFFFHQTALRAFAVCAKKLSSKWPEDMLLASTKLAPPPHRTIIIFLNEGKKESKSSKIISVWSNWKFLNFCVSFFSSFLFSLVKSNKFIYFHTAKRWSCVIWYFYEPLLIFLLFLLFFLFFLFSGIFFSMFSAS